jgi:hypothetical protein
MEQKQMPAQISAYHHRNLTQTRLPVWQFTGLALLAVAIVAGTYGEKADKEQQASYVQSPMAGDVFEMKTGSGAYTTFKVVNVKSDSVQVRLNDYEVNTLSGITKIDKEENYSDSTYTMPVSSLNEMFTAGEIVDVNRH